MSGFVNKEQLQRYTDGLKNKFVLKSEEAQPDWEQDDTSANDFVKNKPAIKAGLGNYSTSENYAIASGTYAHAEGGGDRAYNWTVSFVSKTGNEKTYQYRGSSMDASGMFIIYNNAYVSPIVKYTYSSPYNNITIVDNGNRFPEDTIEIKLRETLAQGNYSHAEGTSMATATCSHSEGYKTKSSGSYSHAEGSQTVASGYASHAEGDSAYAIGDRSHAEGHGTASGNYSHAEGRSLAKGNYSHSEGLGGTSGTARLTYISEHIYSMPYDKTWLEGLTFTYNGTSYKILRAVYDGSKTIMTVEDSYTETGTYNTVSFSQGVAAGDRSHVEGHYNNTIGENSHAEGQYNNAAGANSHVFGMYNIPDNDENIPLWVENTLYEVGDKVKYNNSYYICKNENSDSSWTSANWLKTLKMNYVEVVGNGEDSARSNARTLDWEGNEWLAGTLSCSGVSVNGTSLTPTQAMSQAQVTEFINNL